MMPASLYKIDITETLYQFDEPVLFVGRVGLLSALFLKTDESEEGHEFVSCYIDKEHIEALRDGRISIRGAFEAQKDIFLVHTGFDYGVRREERVEKDALEATRRLPRPGAGILPRMGECPDVLQEKDALLTVYFRGAHLNRTAIEYSSLISMLSKVQSLARNVLAPPQLRGLRNATFDFLVGDPALGSLMISIKSPTVHLGRLRRAKERRNITYADVASGVQQSTDQFVEGLEDLVRLSGSKSSAVDDEDEIFASLHDLLPSESTPYSNVMFSTEHGGRMRRVAITRERADQLRQERDQPDGSQVRRSGVIIEINAASRTLLLRSRIGNVSTCVFDRDQFESLRRNVDFKIGSRMQVAGELTARVRRDKLRVESVLLLEPVSSR